MEYVDARQFVRDYDKCIEELSVSFSEMQLAKSVSEETAEGKLYRSHCAQKPDNQTIIDWTERKSRLRDLVRYSPEYQLYRAWEKRWLEVSSKLAALNAFMFSISRSPSLFDEMNEGGSPWVG